jgi:hypothetical protein
VEQKANAGSHRRFQRGASRNIELRVNPKRPPAKQVAAICDIAVAFKHIRLRFMGHTVVAFDLNIIQKVRQGLVAFSS